MTNRRKRRVRSAKRSGDRKGRSVSVNRQRENIPVEANEARSNESRSRPAPAGNVSTAATEAPVTPETDSPIKAMSEEDLARLLRPDDEDESERLPDYVSEAEAHDDEMLEAARMLRITRMPPSTSVEESEIGRAFGQWVLTIRCECGRRWFEVEPIYRAQCPRCGKIVFVEVEPDDL